MTDFGLVLLLFWTIKTLFSFKWLADVVKLLAVRSVKCGLLLAVVESAPTTNDYTTWVVCTYMAPAGSPVQTLLKIDDLWASGVDADSIIVCQTKVNW